MKKFNRPLILGIAVVFLALVFIGLFLVDIGINSKFFIKRNFTKAYEYLYTGDCDSYNKYLYENSKKNTCEELKANKEVDLKDFKILYATHDKFFSDRAFLLVKMTYCDGTQDGVITKRFEMKKVIFNWKIK
jgi:hypothetical protein